MRNYCLSDEHVLFTCIGRLIQAGEKLSRYQSDKSDKFVYAPFVVYIDEGISNADAGNTETLCSTQNVVIKDFLRAGTTGRSWYYTRRNYYIIYRKKIEQIFMYSEQELWQKSTVLMYDQYFSFDSDTNFKRIHSSSK